MPRRRKEITRDTTMEAANTTSRRALIGVIIAAVLTLAGGIVVALINGWFSVAKTDPPPVDGIYRVRVTVINPQDLPIEDARVWSSFGGEAKKVSGGWEFDIPSGSKPHDGKLTVFASQESAYLIGRSEVVLTNDYNPAVSIQLHPDDSAMMRGQVLDEKGYALSQVRVWVVGYGKEVVTTNNNGGFELPAHAADNEQVRLHAEKSGYSPVEEYAPAGLSITLTLKR